MPFFIFLFLTWKFHRKTGSPLLSVGQPDGSAVKFCQLFGNAESQTKVLLVTSGGIGLIKSVKDIRLVLIRDSASLINHLKSQYTFLEIGRCPDMDGAPGRRITGGVVQEYKKKLAKALRIPLNPWKRAVRKIQAEMDVFFAA